jgi:hypothetical protein
MDDQEDDDEDLEFFLNIHILLEEEPSDNGPTDERLKTLEARRDAPEMDAKEDQGAEPILDQRSWWCALSL